MAIARSSPSESPEILDSGATIARRIIEIGDPDADVAAMALRHAVWRVHEVVGDGTATTAVLFQSIVREGLRMLAAGNDAVSLRSGIEWGLARAVEAIHGRARPLVGRNAIVRCALAACNDARMAEIIGEIFDIVGPDGYVDVREDPSRGIEREYVEGCYWPGTWLSRHVVDQGLRDQSFLDNAAVIVSDLSIQDPNEMIAVLELARGEGISRLFLVAHEMSDAALAVLLANHQAGIVKSLPVKLHLHGDQLIGAIEDMAVLTGAVPLMQAEGALLSSLKAHHLGEARRIWSTGQNVGIAGGKGGPSALRRQVARLRECLKQAPEAEARRILQTRVGRLLGGMATLLVGGISETEVQMRTTAAERTVSSVRQALVGGVVPGGGSELVRVAQELGSLTVPPRFSAGVSALIWTLEEPLRVIADNAGYEPRVIVDRVREAPEGYCWDALSGNVVDAWETGITDPVEQLETALRVAVTSAALLLTTEVIVHRPRPEIGGQP